MMTSSQRGALREDDNAKRLGTTSRPNKFD
jgi:hypothetical protein